MHLFMCLFPQPNHNFFFFISNQSECLIKHAWFIHRINIYSIQTGEEMFKHLEVFYMLDIIRINSAEDIQWF